MNTESFAILLDQLVAIRILEDRIHKRMTHLPYAKEQLSEVLSIQQTIVGECEKFLNRYEQFYKSGSKYIVTSASH